MLGIYNLWYKRDVIYGNSVSLNDLWNLEDRIWYKGSNYKGNLEDHIRYKSYHLKLIYSVAFKLQKYREFVIPCIVKKVFFKA